MSSSTRPNSITRPTPPISSLPPIPYHIPTGTVLSVCQNGYILRHAGLPPPPSVTRSNREYLCLGCRTELLRVVEAYDTPETGMGMRLCAWCGRAFDGDALYERRGKVRCKGCAKDFGGIAGLKKHVLNSRERRTDTTDTFRGTNMDVGRWSLMCRRLSNDCVKKKEASGNVENLHLASNNERFASAYLLYLIVQVWHCKAFLCSVT